MKTEIEKLIKAQTLIYAAQTLLENSLHHTCVDTAKFMEIRNVIGDYLDLIDKSLYEVEDD